MATPKLLSAVEAESREVRRSGRNEDGSNPSFPTNPSSSNGRTSDFGSENRGSTPREGTKRAPKDKFDRTEYQRLYMRDVPLAKALGLTVAKYRETLK